MALYPEHLFDGNIGKTHTNLVVSEGAYPAEQFVVAKGNPAEPFYYEYGPEGNQLVKLAKGKIVEAVGEELNRRTRYMETAIQIAEEDSVAAIGVNHHNVSEASRTARGGDFNRPTVLTRSYIEVPLFEAENVDAAKASAKAMHFGAAYAGTGAAALKSGDFVVPGADGNFKKYEDTMDARSIIGQVLNVNRNLPPAGLLQYYTGLENQQQIEDYLKTLAPTGNISPYGTTHSVGGWRADFLKQLGYGNLTGIPFLTDGYFSAVETVTFDIDDTDNVETAAGSDAVTVTGKAVAVDVTGTEDVDGTLFIKVKHKFDRRNVNNITVQLDGVDVPDRDVHVDINNNTIVVFLDDQVSATTVSVTADLVVNPTAGIPTEWDYKGSVGATRILLQR